MTKKASTRRTRRTADEARAAILDAAERQLIADGPGAIRLQEVARAVGVSHPTVLHHFGSRDALVKAVVTRALCGLQDDIVAAIAQAPADESHLGPLIDSVFAALGPGGHGRAMAWLALSGSVADPDDARLREIVEVAHALRRRRRGAATPPYEDTVFTILLSFYTLFGQAVIGPAVAQPMLGLGARSEERFRRWLGRLMVAHLHNAPTAGYL